MTDNEVVFESGERVPLQGLPAAFMPFFRMVLERATQFKNLVDWEQQSYCALLAMQFFSGNTGMQILIYENSNPLDLASKASADHVQSKIVNALKDHCSAAQPSKLSKIVEQVYAFDCFHGLGAEVIEYCLNHRFNLSQQLIAVSDVSRAPLRSGDAIPPLTHQSSGHFPLSHVY
uniref:IMS_C domain-containing protein n=1 Tax=Heterorhabditis bacteriophora TaxID=37862 RepID=A0A1I7WIX2_HETBA